MNEDRKMSAQDLGSVEEVVQLMEQVTSSLGSRNYDKSVLSLIIRLNASLKAHGNHMEMFHRELLDKAQVNAGLYYFIDLHSGSVRNSN